MPTSRWTEEGKYKGFNANVDKNLPYHLIFQADKWQPGLEGGNRNFLYSSIGHVEHNIQWENRRNGSFGPIDHSKFTFSAFF